MEEKEKNTLEVFSEKQKKLINDITTITKSGEKTAAELKEHKDTFVKKMEELDAEKKKLAVQTAQNNAKYTAEQVVKKAWNYLIEQNKETGITSIDSKALTLTDILPTEWEQTIIPDPAQVGFNVLGLFPQVNVQTREHDFFTADIGAFPYAQTADAVINFHKEPGAVKRFKVPFSIDVDDFEDAVNGLAAYLAFAASYVGNGMAESAVINGDTTATHMDSTTAASASTDVRKFWKGLRYYALNGTGTKYDLAGTITDDKMTTIRSKLTHAVAKDVNQLFWLMTSGAYFDVLTGCTNVKTLDKFGANALILSGVLERYQNIPVVTSTEFPTVNATGVITGTADTTDGIICGSKKAAMVGNRLGMTLSLQDSAYAKMFYYRLRKAWKVLFTDGYLAIGYNL